MLHKQGWLNGILAWMETKKESITERKINSAANYRWLWLWLEMISMAEFSCLYTFIQEVDIWLKLTSTNFSNEIIDDILSKTFSEGILSFLLLRLLIWDLWSSHSSYCWVFLLGVKLKDFLLLPSTNVERFSKIKRPCDVVILRSLRSSECLSSLS